MGLCLRREVGAGKQTARQGKASARFGAQAGQDMRRSVLLPHLFSAYIGTIAHCVVLPQEPPVVNARDLESALLARCALAAREAGPGPQDQREANVFRLAAMVIHSRFPDEGQCLMRASEQYFVAHPHERLAPAEVVRQGWVLNLPRLRDMLSHQLHGY
jgi:hypothetical protein